MNNKFNTYKSLTFISTSPVLCSVLFMVAGVIIWYETRDPKIIFDLGCQGAFIGTLLYTFSFLRYRNITYEITDKQIIKKRGNRIIRSIKLTSVEYYYFKPNGKYPIVKVKKGKDLSFEMTLGFNDEIVDALKKQGIKPKPKVA